MRLGADHNGSGGAAVKTVGRRLHAIDPLALDPRRVDDAVAWRQACGGVGIPRGVYRFASHQEADAWQWNMIVQTRKT